MDPELSISAAVDSLADDFSSGTPPEGSPTGQQDGQPPAEGKPQDNSGKPEANGQAPKEGAQDKDKQPLDGSKPGQAGDIDPDKGKYAGEYTKERFDGLMSAWQKDRQLASKVPDLENRLKELETTVKNPPKPEGMDTGDLPPELQNADPETQAGFKLLMKASEGKLSQLEEKIVGKIMDTLNRPLREENEIVSKVKQESEQLSVELGKEFADNVAEIKKFAAENNYPLGTLRHAFTAWKQANEINNLKGIKKDGQKTLEEIEAEKAKKGQIPTGGANRSKEVPKWDEKRDGGKSLSQILDETSEYL